MTIKIHIFLSAIIILMVFTAKAQTIRITGNVIDLESGKSISGANVELFKRNILEKKTTSNDSGKYLFLIDTALHKSKIKISLIGYEPVSFTLDLSKSDKTNDFFLGITKLKPTAILLNEVIIKKSKRYRDTSIIDLSNETFERSIMINDLFSQKGLYKDSNGQLFYKGKIVSDVVVNNSNFFGRNNMSLYDKIPALILDNIEIVETNIDSVTNITLISPTIKLNLKLKEKYMKGRFGSLTTGFGAPERLISNAELYSYQNQQQISFMIGSNNIGLNNGFSDPPMTSSVAGNNSKKNYADFFYRNSLGSKLEFVISAKVTDERRNLLLESERNEESIKQFSRTKSSSTMNSFGINDLNGALKYKIDSLNLIKINSNISTKTGKGLDTLNYYVETEMAKTISIVNKSRNTHENLIANEIEYEKQFSNKKGRLFAFGLRSGTATNENNDVNEVIEIKKENSYQYFINGKRETVQNLLEAKASYIEPFGESGYLKILSNIKREKLDYTSDLKSDTLKSMKGAEVMLINDYFQYGLKVQKTLNKISVSGIFNSIINKRYLKNSTMKPLVNYNIDLDVRIDNIINNKKKLTLNYSIVPTYPTVYQLTSISNSFDILSQTMDNFNLKPEVRHSISSSFDFKKSDSLSLTISIDASRYYSKFGFNFTSIPGETQIGFVDNIGNSTSAQIMFSILKSFSRGVLNYQLGLGYENLPIINNDVKTFSHGIELSQSIATEQNLVPGVLIISPNITAALSKFKYDNGTGTSLSVIYSDKISLKLCDFEANAFPIANFTRGMNSNNFSCGINAEIKKNVIKTYGTLWLKAYDIFNSLQFRDNILGSTYTQSIKYSNQQRYILIGFNLRFNNFK